MNRNTAGETGLANTLFGRLVVEGLARLGVAHFVVSPGSRSTPLALAVGELGPDQRTILLDERSAAFHALGRIKANRQPVALICTSGTAGAHYFPAVIEARESGLPLIVLTADRPPELRHCHVGQTIDQLKLFGSYPVFHAELPVPEAGLLLMRQVRGICRQAVEAALRYPMGPVHLNCPFREPFFKAGSEDTELEQALGALLERMNPVERSTPAFAKLPELPARTLILAGPRPWKETAEAVTDLLELSSRHGWPILADAANPLRYRSGGVGPTIIAGYDRIARDDKLWAALAPEALLLWGEPPTSKVLRQRLIEQDLPGWQIGLDKPGMNPVFGQIESFPGCLGTLLDLPGKTADGSFAQAWQQAEKENERGMDKAFQERHELFEGDVHRLLAGLLPDRAQVFFASSLAIRDAEWFLPASGSGWQPYSQRGANGIDGTLSVGRGIASGSGEPLYLVCGDLAFLHDAGGLLGAVKQIPGLFIILINNHGGGIFEFLPVAGRRENFEELFSTPQEADFAQLARAYGARHSLCYSLEALEREIHGWDEKGIFIAEVSVDREQSRRTHAVILG